MQLTEEEAKTYFEQLDANGAVADEEPDAVAGGGVFGISCPGESEEEVVTPGRARSCPHCGATIARRDGVSSCPKCGKSIVLSTSYQVDR